MKMPLVITFKRRDETDERDKKTVGIFYRISGSFCKSMRKDLIHDRRIHLQTDRGDAIKKLPELPTLGTDNVNAQPQVGYPMGKNTPPEAFLTNNQSSVNDPGNHALNHTVVLNTK